MSGRFAPAAPPPVCHHGGSTFVCEEVTDMRSRAALVERYRRNRKRSQALFGMLNEAAYYSRPITLRHPVVFYDGHLPGFSFNTLVKKALGRPGIDARLEALFARGIDPHESTAGQPAQSSWPSRDVVRAFADEADRQVVDALEQADLELPGHPLLDRAEAVYSILEHEEMHQETLLYMWHRLPLDQKTRPDGYRPSASGAPPKSDWVTVPGGQVTLGVDRGAVEFGWDNEFPALAAEVPSFAIERHNVTNDRFLEFVESGGYCDQRWWTDADWQWIRTEHLEHPRFWERAGDAWHWRGLFDLVELPPSWPVYVSQAEASAFARWSGTRLPTEAEFQRAAYGSPDGERPRPWGIGTTAEDAGTFDFASWDPVPAGRHPRGASAWGVEDLVGNGWEWTNTPFAPFPGFQASPSYPEYSADFFDGEHFVLKGASPVTARELVRPTFRNWFRARYPYVYATFRTVKA
jgi:ergothioneine biosynthesis protein EgtB